jgi:cell filamentation protein
MADQRRRRPDRYETSGNPEAEYVDVERTVLLNRKGIANLRDLQIAEEEALAAAYEVLLGEVRTDTPMTCELLQYIHARIFGDLFEWGGKWRTVWLRKPGVTWPPPDFLDQSMRTFEREVLRKSPAGVLADDAAFCRAAGEIEGEFLVIHPFREGNARTIKLMVDLLAAQTGRPLLVYDSTEQGQQEYISAAKAAFMKNYAPMAAVIQAALTRAQKAP